jgi:pantoate--beta-alanine ligase
VACETLREPDGLALSSRNRYLNPEQRQRALLLSRALAKVEQMMDSGVDNVDQLQLAMRQTLLGEAGQPGVDKIDYAVVADATTLAPMSVVKRPAVALIAAFVGTTRLIDNRELPAAIC